MKPNKFKVYLACLHMGIASTLLLLGRAEYLAHYKELGRTGVLYQFDYFPVWFQWLAALYAPSGLLALPIAVIPRVPGPIVAIWFVLWVGVFWYWLCSQLEIRKETRQSLAPVGIIPWVELSDWLGLFLGLILCVVSAAAARHGGSPVVVDICGFLWGLCILALSARSIWRIRFERAKPSVNTLM
jgi:hypothetical protein